MRYVVFAMGLWVAASSPAATVWVSGYTSEDVQAAIDAAGVGGIVLFPGGTYTIDRRIVPALNQTLQGYGATLRRADAKVTTLTVAALEDDTTLTVADASIYSVGDQVTPVGPGGGYDDVEHNALTVDSIDGNVITLSGPIEQDYAIGDKISDTYRMLGASGRNAWTLKGMTIDGNRANQVFTAWIWNKAVHGYEGLKVVDCYFMELPGDAIASYGGGQTIERNVFSGIDGAALHLANDWTEDVDTIIRDNTFVRTNEKVTLASHSEGVLTISQRANNIRVETNHASEIGVPFIAEFHGDMHDWYVYGNVLDGVVLLGSQLSSTGTDLDDVEFTLNVVLGAPLSQMDLGSVDVTTLVFKQNDFRWSSVKLVDCYGTSTANQYRGGLIIDGGEVVQVNDWVEP